MHARYRYPSGRAHPIEAIADGAGREIRSRRSVGIGSPVHRTKLLAEVEHYYFPVGDFIQEAASASGSGLGRSSPSRALFD